MMRRPFLPSLLAFLVPTLAILAPSCSAPSGGARPEHGAAAARGPAPEAGRLAQDVRWLADDAREGRRAGTRGEEQASRWLAQRLEALGLEPAGSEGYLQPFEVPLPVRDGGDSSIEVRRGEQTVRCAGEGVVPLFCSSGDSAEGPLVFAGYGIADAELGRDDFAGLALDGAVVVLVRGTPPDELLPAAAEEADEAPANPHGQAQPARAGWGGAGSVFYKVMEAKRRGARAVILAQHPTRDEAMLAFGEGGGAQARLPALHVSAARAAELVPDYAALVARLDRGESVGSVEAGTARLVASVFREKGTAHNVLARLRGQSSARVLLIGAHFDHLGFGGEGSLAPAAQGQIHNGADDNASGTATVLEIARCLAAGPKPAFDVVFALWSGEELGLLGSEHWARNPTIPLETLQANLNLDMVGRAESGKLSVLGAGSAAPFEALLASAGPKADLALQVSLSGQGVGGSDHQTFLKREIPSLHFFTGLHTDYHRPSDDFERFESHGAARVAALVLDLVAGLQGRGRLTFVAPQEEAPGTTPGGFKTRFGSIPDYAWDGPGMRLDGTSPGGPAEKAGLLKGDVLVAIGDQKLDGLGDFMHVLNTHKPGDVITVHYLRAGAQESCRVTLESSQVE